MTHLNPLLAMSQPEGSGMGGTEPLPVAHCPKCGTAMAPGSAEGMCPRCLMGVGLGTQPAPETGAEAGAATASAPPDPAELAPHFPSLEILEVIGQGGMGVVYRARQVKLDRVVALKVLSRGAAKDPAFAERFNREARTLARLNHPNIVTVFDFGETDGLFYLVMEYVDGADLRRVLQQGRLSPEEALRIVPVICGALQYAHASGVVHRDIKPGNILMDREGRVKIADFGIAKLAGQSASDATLTQSRQSMGTLHYMAPEQVENPQSVDHRADIYSLGVVFYEMLTGELPLGRFAPPSRRVQVDVRLDEVVLRALEKEPDRRYQQAGDVKTEVERITVGGGNAGAKASREAGRSASWQDLPGWGWMTGGIVWALMLGLMFLSVRRLREPGGTGPSGFVWLLAYMGALAPVGTTFLGWMAYRSAERSGVNRRAVRASLWVMHALPALGLAAVCVGLTVAFVMEVVGVRGGAAAVLVTLGIVAILAAFGWGLHRWVLWCRRMTELKASERPGWFPWLPLGPVVVGLGCATFLIAGIHNIHARSRVGTPAFQVMLENPGLPELQAGAEVPLLGTPSSHFPALAEAPALWTMTESGPVLTNRVLQILGGDATQLSVLNAALRKGWDEYREILRRNTEKTTNAVGHAVIEVRPMVSELEAITDRFWTAADAVLNPAQQLSLRNELGPQLRPRWSGGAHGRGLYLTKQTLFRFGGLRFFLEYWREGSWYRYRHVEGDVHMNNLDGLWENRAPELPEDLKILLE